MFELCGLLFGLAIYNGITLPVNLPPAFYSTLFRQDYTISTLNDGWPTIQKSLDSISREDIPGLDWVFPLEANGLRLTVTPQSSIEPEEGDRYRLRVVEATQIVYHELPGSGSEQPGSGSATTVDDNTAINLESIADAWPGWHLVQETKQPVAVTAKNKAEYVKEYVRWLVDASVAPQWDAFEKGFYSTIDRDTLPMLAPRHLQTIVEGSGHFDISEVRYAVDYVDYDPASKYIQKFWRLVTDWPEEKQRQLLKFVTATDRMPAGGASNFSFRIERPKPYNADYLPASSTCFRTLFLPKYSSTEVLDQKMSLAFKYGLEGFGTG